MCTYGRGLERLLAHIYIQPVLVYIGWVGTEKQRRRRVHGEATECLCSWGGNGMRHVHREAMERVGANRLGQNEMRGRVHREGLDGTGDGNEA